MKEHEHEINIVVRIRLEVEAVQVPPKATESPPAWDQWSDEIDAVEDEIEATADAPKPYDKEEFLAQVKADFAAKQAAKEEDPAAAKRSAAAKKAAETRRLYGETVDEVLDYYRRLHPQARPGDPARERILARLREGFGRDQLVDAIEGNHADPHCRGMNALGKKYHSLDLIFRDSEHVQAYIEALETARGPVESVTTQRTNEAIDQVVDQVVGQINEVEAEDLGAALLPPPGWEEEG